MAYARGHRRVAVLAYGSLIVATFAQLIVPQLVNIIVDTVVGGIQADSDARAVAPALLGAMIAIVVFAWSARCSRTASSTTPSASPRTSPSTSATSSSPRSSDCPSSYLDRTQTGQLMIRATDDVEKVRLFIGQGLVIAVQSCCCWSPR